MRGHRGLDETNTARIVKWWGMEKGNLKKKRKDVSVSRCVWWRRFIVAERKSKARGRDI